MASNNQQEGIVIETSGKTAKVKTSRHNDCANCGACPGNSAMILEASNQLGAKAGQKVVVEIQEINMLKAAFTVYLLPLIMVAIGILAGGEFSSWTGASVVLPRFIGGAGLFFAALWYIKHYESNVRSDKKAQPVIIRVLS